MTTKFDVESLGPGGRYAVERVAEITALSSSSRVLELGAGHGIAAIHLAETRACRVVATDVNTDALARLHRRVMELRLEGLVDASRLDCTLPFPHAPESFDLVLAGSVLDRTTAMEITISEAYRVLRPGGHLAIYGAIWKRDLEDLRVVRVLGKDVRSLPDYELLLARQGFRIAASRLLPDHLWSDYYRQFIDALEEETEDMPDMPQPWGWYEEAAVVLTHTDAIGVGLVVGRKDPVTVPRGEPLDAGIALGTAELEPDMPELDVTLPDPREQLPQPSPQNSQDHE